MLNIKPVYMKNKRLKFIIGLFCGIFILSSYAQTPYSGKIGVNLGYVDYVNWVKATNRVNYVGGQVQLADSSLDTNMWPKCDFNVIWDHRPAREWDLVANPIDDPEKYRIDYSGIYKGSFNGLAVLKDIEPHGTWTFQNQKYDTATNKTTFEVNMSAPGPHHGLITIEFSKTRRTLASDTNTGITNFKFIKPGYDTASTQIFTDEVFTGLGHASFSTIRAMSLTATTQIAKAYPDTIGWNTRKKYTDPWWGGGIGKKPEGAPWEAFIDLCNQANMDMWVNIPIAATDNYMVQLAKLIQTRLNAGLHVYIEIENEVWGFAIPKAYNEAEAKEKGITAAQNYAVHAYRASQAFQNVFGAGSLNDKVRVVLMWWSLSPGDLDKMCDYITKTYSAANQNIYGIGVAHYFSNNLMSGKQAASVEDIVISSYASANDDTLNYKLMATIATKYNLTAKGNVSYEGGAAMCDPNNPNVLTDGNDILAYRDSCMAASVRKLYINCNKYKAVLSNYFTLAGGFSRYGCWGLTDDLAKPQRTSLTKAMQELLGDVTSPIPPADLFALKQANNKYKLIWKDQSSDETGFIIERKDTNGKYILVKQVASNISSYIDSVGYYLPKYYRVKALNGSGTSTYANLALVIDSTPPPAPKNLIVYDITKSSAKAKWNKANWSDIKEYRIFKNGLLQGVTQDTNYTLIGLYCGDTYKINVVTVSTSIINSVYSDTVTIVMCVSLEKVSNTISVIPNPTTGRVKIIGNGDAMMLSIINTWGEVLKTTNITTSESELDISAYPDGVYFIQINTGKTKEAVKIIKQQ
jgi:hypothetical protein